MFRFSRVVSVSANRTKVQFVEQWIIKFGGLVKRSYRLSSNHKSLLLFLTYVGYGTRIDESLTTLSRFHCAFEGSLAGEIASLDFPESYVYLIIEQKSNLPYNGS